MSDHQITCSFCSRNKQDTEILIAGANAHICNSCIEQAFHIVEQDSKSIVSIKKTASDFKLLKPIEIKSHLDDYVIGQDQAKKNISVAVYNHYKRISQVNMDDDEIEIEKSNIIMVGKTGTGKTLLAKSIAKLLNVPFCIADATVLTEAGYVGEDVESILSRLLQAADYDVEKAKVGIVFIDEIDKVCARSERLGGDVSREGVQRDLLPLIEGTVVTTKHGTIKTDHILFIASGAFQLAKPSDLLPELQGRLPIRVALNALSQDDFKRILKEPKFSLIKQYEALMQTEEVKITFTEDGIDALATLAVNINTSIENIGARRLHTILERVLEDISFSASDRKGQTVVVDAEYVSSNATELSKDTDLSKFIL